MAPAPGYRGLRRTPNRQALLAAAEELFGRHGFSAVSVDQIVARAGVAKGTFYNHFRDKDDIAGQAALAIRHEVRDRIAADNLYIDSWSLGLDIAILAKTAMVIFRDPQAY